MSKRTTTEKTTKKTPSYDYKQFVDTWTNAMSPQEVADALKLSRATVNHVSMRLRKAGVPLKAMPRGKKATPIDVEELTRIAKQAKKTKTKD